MKYLYVCGPTVYDKVHIGNIRPILTFDLFLRGANYQNKNFVFLHNITDIDDKIIKKSIEVKSSELEVSTKYTKYYLDILEELNINKPDYIEKVTDNILMIIDYIKIMVDNGSAYVKNGSVYFDIDKYKDVYGTISNIDLSQNIYEDEDNLDKKNKYDFALWKNTIEGITWDSPWSKGRPGWHTECSALIRHIFKVSQIDIHGGGIDLLFPHNENENIQNYAVTKKPLAKEWIHVGHIKWNGEKMSKSLKNIIYADDFINKYGVDTFRSLLLNTSYSSPINLTIEMIESNIKITDKFNKIYYRSLLTTKEKRTIIQQSLEEFEYKSKFLNEVANKLEVFKFSDVSFLINQKIKSFNKSNHIDDAFDLLETFKLLGYAFSNADINEEDYDNYLSWIKFKDKKDYPHADQYLNLLKEKGIL